jgi:poly(3-hydroxybutyrate) depolymerase
MTTQYACQADSRFSYWMYVPQDYRDEAGPYPVIVPVHGTHRRGMMYRDQFSPFAEKHQCIVMAPQFPAGISGPDDLSGYKFLEHEGLRYDRVLNAMLEEVSARYNIDQDACLLFGFSGGAHFVHRYFYLHAERIIGLSIGAPGMVTLLDREKAWHCGVGDVSRVFSQAVRWEFLPKTPVHMIVGAGDTETWEITIQASSPWWMEGVNDSGGTRIERLASLKRSYEAHGIDVTWDLVPATGHDSARMIAYVERFFETCLSRHRELMHTRLLGR